MNKLIIPFALLLFISCVTDKKQVETPKLTKGELFLLAKANLPKKAKKDIINEMQIINDELYTLQFKIETTKNNQHNLVIDMKLHKGSSFISPFEEKEFLGKFYMDLGDYTNLTFDGNLIEAPKANSRYDGFKNAQVIWVEENTTYKQLLNIKTDEGFEVFGRVIFTIEPRCSLETIPFGLSYKNGKFIFFDPKC
jgi:hypothetical protein